MQQPACAYGINCYRKNPQHFLTYSHPAELQRSAAVNAQDSSSPPAPAPPAASIVDQTTVVQQSTVTEGQPAVTLHAASVSPAVIAPVQQEAKAVIAGEATASMNDSGDSDASDEIPPLVPLLRQLSVSAKSGLLGSAEKAHIKNLLLSGNKTLVLSAATILSTLGPAPLPPQASAFSQPVEQSSSGNTEAKVGLVMYVLRGISGSGKSTLSVQLTTQSDGSRVGSAYSTDDFFVEAATGAYQFDGSRLQEAHTWNQRRVKTALETGISPVVVDNTHTQCWEAQPYVVMAMRFGYEVRVQEPSTWWAKDANELARRNQHGVPLEAIQRMLDRWEADFSLQAILASKSPGRRKPTRGEDRSHKKSDKPVRAKAQGKADSEFKSPNGAQEQDAARDDVGQDDWQEVTKKSHRHKR
jgi:NEDD4-binding protein 2